MVHITLNSRDVQTYAAAFGQLLSRGCRTQLLCGISSATAKEFLAATACERSSTAVELISTDVETPEIKRLGRDEAFSVDRCWDAVILFCRDEQEKRGFLRDVFRLASVPSLVYPAQRAEKVVVVSIRKSGTHLVAELMRALGYRVIGPHIPFHDPENLSTLRRLDREEPGTCILTHHLDAFDAEDAPHLAQWMATGEPAIILNYRDPRDATCSLVHYVMGETVEPFSPLFSHFLRSDIFHGLPSHEDRLLRATIDPCFSLLREFEAETWMLGHSRICELTFERLVGVAGGGSQPLQLRETARAMAHLGVGGDVTEISRKLFNPSVRVFFRGQIGAWRKEFTAKNMQAFNRVFGSILELYGYATESTEMSELENAINLQDSLLRR